MTAQKIADKIRENCAAERAGLIDWEEFSRRQRAAWDLIAGRRGVHIRVLNILNGRKP